MPSDPLSATFAALADPTRRAILSRLASGDASVTELAAPFDMSLPAVSKHLKVLERAGLVARSQEAQWRPRSIQPAPLKDVSEWVERYRQLWEERLDRLDDYLRELSASQAEPATAPAASNTRNVAKGDAVVDSEVPRQPSARRRSPGVGAKSSPRRRKGSD